MAPGFSTLERNPGPAAAATSKLAEGDQGTRGPFGHSSVTTTLGVVGPQKPEQTPSSTAAARLDEYWTETST